MPNIFNGQISDTNGRKLEAVNVIITGPNIPPNTSTKSNKNGEWSISLTQNVNDKDITITFSKKGLETKVVKGPAPTAIIPGYIDPDKGGSLNLQSLFASGKYKVTSIAGKEKDILDQELEDLFQFIKKNRNVKIKIRSSESKVTNSDNEDGSRTQEFRNQPGSLAKARAEALQQYITDFINNRINSDTSIINPDNYRPVFDANEANITRVGSAQWEVQNGVLNQTIYDENQALLEEYNKAAEANGTPQIQRHADLPKYKNDQYVALDVELILTPKTKDCTKSNLVFDVMYITSGHKCNAAVYQFKGNGQILLRDDGADYASLNNNITNTVRSSDIKEDLKEKKVSLYENITTGYNKKREKESIKSENRGRFKLLKVGDSFPIYDLTPPTTQDIGGKRFNRFILTSDMLKKLTEGLEEKIIQFQITCYNPTNYKAPLWGYDCHRDGISSYILYQTVLKDGVMTVISSSDVLDGESPYTRDSFVPLFDYDVCEGKIVKVNKTLFRDPSLSTLPSVEKT